MNVDWIQVSGFVETVGGVLGLLGFLATLYLRSSFVAKHDHERDMKEIDGRLARSDQRHAGMATNQEVADVRLMVEQVSGVMKALDATVKGLRDLLDKVSDGLDRVESHLLHTSGR